MGGKKKKNKTIWKHVLPQATVFVFTGQKQVGLRVKQLGW